MNKYAKYAKLSIGGPNDGWRWSVMGNPDLPECVDLVYETFDNNEWSARFKTECIDVNILNWLAKHAKIVVEIEDGKET